MVGFVGIPVHSVLWMTYSAVDLLRRCDTKPKVYTSKSF
jgi:hypothetical protein